ncbi:glycosyltransferase family 4 protein [Candidatus Pacearchaeota archaeon]|nr:glycosyltransferase family 4 protein [Candidatus Pacearchaeota archaeon]
MKILEICEFSAGICGVWTRVFHESKLLQKLGHEVYVFSSDIEKGTGKKVSLKELREKIEICRFPSRKTYFSGNVHAFNFEKELKKLKPHIVITHLIHPHSFRALKLCREMQIPCIIVTHAPFDVKRNFPLNIITWAYYNFHVKKKIRGFDKVIAITKWESPHLLKMGASPNKIIYLPNGIPSEFFRQKIKPFRRKKLMFLGRVAPVKKLETLIASFNKIEDKHLVLEIVGPVEKGYEEIKNYSSQRIIFSPTIRSLNAKIKKLQEADIFILPSMREGLPQSLIEAMALGKIVVSSDTAGAKEVIIDGKNGFLFNIGDKDDLAEKIKHVLKMHNSDIAKMQKAARNSVRGFDWKIVINKLNKLVKSYKK